MEYAFHPIRSTLSFSPPNSTFLSTKDACALLDKREIIEIDDTNFQFNSTWKTVTLLAFMVGLIGGFSAFLSVTENNFYIDHSNDYITKYRCIKEYWTSSYKENVSIAVKCRLPIDEKTALPFETIEDLMDLDMLTETEYKLLSFEQIKIIKNNDLKYFLKLLRKERFSEIQVLYWNKLHKILKLKDAELKRALQNPLIIEMFEEEPKILETLILEMDQLCFNDTVKILALRLESIHEVFSDLGLETRIQIVELMKAKILSFEKAFTQFQILSLENVGNVKLQFNDESIEVPIHLLCFASQYFNKLLKGQFSHSKDIILLPDLDPDAFKELASYLATGLFEVKENTNLLSILEIADGYEFVSLFEQIEDYLCKNVKSIIEETIFLEEIDKYPLNHFKKAFDLQISKKLSIDNLFTDDFLENLETIKKFSLSLSFSKVVEIFDENIMEIAKQDLFITHFFKISQIDLKLMEALFFSLILAFENSDLLKTLWDEAVRKESYVVQDEIVKLCNDPKYAYLSLAHWALPPKQIKKQCMENDEYELVELLHDYSDREYI